MIDFLRKKVSGKKNRYECSGHSLDLTYITPRLIAMSLPGEGLHKFYRNSIDSVAEVLKNNHKANCKVINISGIRYDYEKFHNNVQEFQWADHFPPTIDLLFHACQEIHSWLCDDVEHVVAVNCKAGKGRTGTLICCYLIFCGRIEKASDALEYFKVKRFSHAGGVTQPSQIRYVYYFEDIFKRRVQSPLVVRLSKCFLKTAPHFNGKACRPVFEMFQGQQKIFSNKSLTRDAQRAFEDDWTRPQEFLIFEKCENVEIMPMYGDIQCFLTNWGLVKTKKICRFTFNTGFVNQLSLNFSKNQVDPDNIQKKKNFHQNFEVCMEFEKDCHCSSQDEFNTRCIFCKVKLDEGEVDKWFRIKEIIRYRLPMNARILLFGNPELDDIDKVIKKQESRRETV
jgi:phosphatidylinositol-3,4,5-trisphosphate 3-phosphatase/dual-specificity protein phosphatase PTEN